MLGWDVDTPLLDNHISDGSAPRRRLFGVTIALALGAFSARPLDAQQVQQRFSQNLRGSIDIVGNTLHTCNTSQSNCQTALNGGDGANNDFNMVRVNVDPGGGNFASSSATLTIPVGASVVFAGLYWFGLLDDGDDGDPAPNPSQANQAKFRVPRSLAYTNLTGTRISLDDDYTTFVDVTAQVRAAGSGEYTVANVQAGTGEDTWSGWSLVVVLADPSQPLRNLTIFDGLGLVESGNDVTFNVSGFLTPAVGAVRTRLGVVTGEGDQNLAGDSFRLEGTTIFNTVSPSNNFFNSSISRDGSHVTERNPASRNTLSVDIDQLNTDGVLANGATSATITLTTNSDRYFPLVVTFATELEQPDFSTTAGFTKVALPNPVIAGDTVTYLISVRNTGLDGANNAIVTDTLAPNVRYVPGSLIVLNGTNPGAKTDAAGDDQAEFLTSPNRLVIRLGVGANAQVGGLIEASPSLNSFGLLRYKVVTDSATPGGTPVVNQAHLAFASQTLGTVDNLPSDGDPSTPNREPTQVIIETIDPTITKTGGTFVHGQNATFTLTVTNNGTLATVGPVTVVDTVPATLPVTSATGPGWICTVNGQIVTCTRGEGLPGKTSFPPITITVLVDESAPTSLVNNAHVNGGGDRFPGNNSDDFPITITSVNDVSVAKTGPLTATAGDTVTYSIAVRNSGPSAAQDITVTDTLPPGVTFVSAGGFSTGTLSGNVVTWPAQPPLAAGETRTFTVVVVVDATTTGLLTNAAAITLPAGDANLANNVSRARTLIRRPADVVVTKAGPATATVGQQITYTVTATNAGPGIADDVVLTDNLPSGVTFVSATGGGTLSGNVVTWPTVDSLAVDQAVSFQLTVSINSTTVGPITNTTSAVSSSRDPNLANNSAALVTTVSPASGISVTKQGPIRANAGESITYSITVSNAGPSAADNVVVTDTLPPSVTFVSATGGGTLSGNVVTWPAIPSLAAGASQSFQITVAIAPTQLGFVRNIGAATTTTFDPNLADNRNIALTAVGPEADVRVTKTATPTATTGDNITYAITVTNAGPSTAQDVVVSDVLPAGVTFVSADRGGVLSGQTVTWPTIPTLAVGQTETFQVVVSVPPTTSGVVTNVATASGRNPDPDTTSNSGGATTNVVVMADVSVNKTGQLLANPGDAFTYNITVANAGPSPAVNVVVTDTLPSGVTFVSATNGGTLSGNVVTWPTIPTLAAGASQTFQVSVTVNATTLGVMRNVAAATSVTPDPNPANNRNPAFTRVGPEADVRVSKTAPASATTGNAIIYTITATNAGPSRAQDVVVADLLSAGLVFVSANRGGVLSGRTVTWPTLDTLGVGQVESFEVVATVSPTASGTVTNVATAVGRNPDPDTTNNTGSANTNVALVADVSVSKGGPVAASAGDTLTYTIAVTNAGPSTAANVVVSDTLPAGVTFVSASNGGTLTGNVVSWPAIPSLAAGANQTFQLRVATSPQQTGAITNVAGATSSTPDPNPANNRGTLITALTAAADVSVSKTGPASALPGDTITYTIAVTNTGGTPAQSVVVTDTLPASLTFISASGGGTLSGNVVTWPPINPLAPGATQTFTVRAVVESDATGSISNTASVTSPTVDPNPGNNNSTTTTEVSPIADLQIVVTGPPRARVNDTITYIVTITNKGPGDAVNVVARDTFPEDVRFLTASTDGVITPLGSVAQASAPQAGAAQERSVFTRATHPTLAAGASITFQIKALILPSITDRRIVNVGVTFSTTPDPILRNNVDTAVTIIDVADIALTKRVVGTVQVGAISTFALDVTNRGNAPTIGPITIVDTLPTTMTFRSATGDGWTCSAAGQIVTCRHPAALPAGATTTVLVNVTVAVGVQQITNTAVATTPGDSASAGNNIGTVTAPVVPLSPITLAKAVSTPVVEVADIVEYALVVRNVSNAIVPDVVIDDALPAGIMLVRGSVRIDQHRVDDPEGTPGPRLRILVGDLQPRTTTTVLYRARVAPTARLGDGINRAIARSITSGAQTAIVTARVELRGGVFTERGMIMGRVYAMPTRPQQDDGDGNGDVQPTAQGARGIAGVRVVLEDGTTAISDEMGRYNFYGLTARLHVLKIDATTLPTGMTPAIISNRNARDPWSRFVDLRAGELARADFMLTSTERGVRTIATPAPAPSTRRRESVTGGEVALRRDSTALQPLRNWNPPRGLADSLPMLKLPGNGIPVPHAFDLVTRQEARPADGVSRASVLVTALDTTSDMPVTLETTLGRWDIADLDSIMPGTQTVLRRGRGTFNIVAPTETGTARVRVLGATTAGETHVVFVPALRQMLTAGLLEARVDARDLPNTDVLDITRPAGFDDPLRNLAVGGNGLRGGLVGAAFARGTIGDKTLLTLGYDSERDRDRGFFRNIQPDEFYPIYGDAAAREFFAQSESQFYARVDRGAAFAMFGDILTARRAPEDWAIGTNRELGLYNRTLNGFFGNLEGTRGAIRPFAAYDRVNQVVDEEAGRGISGPYYVNRTNVRAGSEKVEILTRDRNQRARILRVVPLERFTDYEFDALTGSLIMRVPLPSMDDDFNPISVRVTYEIEGLGDRYAVAGANALARLGRNVELNGGFVQDYNPFNSLLLGSVGSTVRLHSTTKLLGEVAFTNTDSSGSGAGLRMELHHRSRRFAATAFGLYTDSSFRNPSSSVTPGRIELGLQGAWTFDRNTRLLIDALRTEEDIIDGVRNGASLALERSLGRYLRGQLGYRFAHETTRPADSSTVFATPNNTQALRLRVESRIPGQERAGVFAEYEQDLSRSQRRGFAGGDYVVGGLARVYGRYEWISSFAGPFALNEDQKLANVVIGIDAAYMRDGHYFSEYRVRDAINGRDAEAAIGLRNRIPVARGVWLNTSLEHVAPIEGINPPQEATAITGALEFLRSRDWKASARVEYRFARDKGCRIDAEALIDARRCDDDYLVSLGYTRRLGDGWSLLGDSRFGARSGDLTSRNAIGAAWRQEGTARWNALARIEQRYDRAPGNFVREFGRLGVDGLVGDSVVTVANAGLIGDMLDFRRSAWIASTHLNFMPQSRLTLSGQLAGKFVDYDSFDESTQINGVLGMLRATYDIDRDWDVGVIGSLLGASGLDRRNMGLGLEVGRTLVKNLQAVAGYNLFGFYDPDFRSESATQQGLSLRFRYKFDEQLLRGMVPGVPRR